MVADALAAGQPLAARMRPETLDEVVGQPALLGPDGFLRAAIAGDRVPSMVLYGPPGSGKTTLARVVARSTKAAFEELSAVSATLTDARAAMGRARDRLAAGGRTVLFLDEIHRFNKAQQDALLPAVEDGLLTLIGATTENPYYEVNAALISRMRVMILEELGPEAIGEVVDRAIASPRGLAGRVALEPDARAALIARAGGDARAALNLLEAAAGGVPDGSRIGPDAIQAAAGGRAVVYDREGDAHYDTISAFIKSLRGSDPDAAVYYLAVMLAGGEDPKYIARRLIVAASEDVGNADPEALRGRRGGGARGGVRRPARGAHHPRPGDDLPRAGAEVERELPGDQRGDRSWWSARARAGRRWRCATPAPRTRGTWGTARATATRTTRPTRCSTSR